MKDDKIICPYCHEDKNYIKKGFRYNSNSEKIQTYQCQQCHRRFSENTQTNINDDEIVEMNVKLAKQKQKLADVNRIERKTFRENARLDNVIEEYSKKIYELLLEHNKELKKQTIKHKIVKNKDNYYGIITLFDIHFNELIDLPNNQYDFDIASLRLKKFADNIKLIFKTYNIKNILIGAGGDFLNSDRRKDEILSAATNRAKATILGANIIKQFLLDLNTEFNIKFVGVLGNEGRIHEEMTYSDFALSDNFDFMIYEILKIMLKDCKGIEFGETSNVETLVNIGERYFLFKHGFDVKTKIEDFVQKIIGKYSLKGISLDYVFMGHFHSTRIGDLYARSSSLCGSNSYNENSLNLFGKASQNCFIINNSNIHGIKIDLQTIDNYNSKYNIISSLKEYNPKSSQKNYKETTIMKIII